MIELIADILFEIQNYLFKKKKKKQRAYEKKHNLPKKRMISPNQRVYIVIGIFSLLCISFFSLPPLFCHSKTKKKIKQITKILEEEKSILGTYPQKLDIIVRNNPLRKTITKDCWGNPFRYNLINKDTYELISAGKDGIFNTKDDIN